jgi:hypothetical protein
MDSLDFSHNLESLKKSRENNNTAYMMLGMIDDFKDIYEWHYSTSLMKV